MTSGDPHARAIENLSAYLDDQLAADERAELEAHLASCPSCQAELASLRQTVALLRAVPPVRAPRSFVLDPARVRPPPIPIYSRRFYLLGQMTGALAATFVAVLMLSLVAGPTAVLAPREAQLTASYAADGAPARTPAAGAGKAASSQGAPGASSGAPASAPNAESAPQAAAPAQPPRAPAPQAAAARSSGSEAGGATGAAESATTASAPGGASAPVPARAPSANAPSASAASAAPSTANSVPNAPADLSQRAVAPPSSSAPALKPAAGAPDAFQRDAALPAPVPAPRGTPPGPPLLAYLAAALALGLAAVGGAWAYVWLRERPSGRGG